MTTDALSTPDPNNRLERPPTSGPGSGRNEWAAFAAQELNSSIDQFDGLSRDEIKVLLDHNAPKPDVREAPEGVDVIAAEETEDGGERAPRITDSSDRPVWAVPVEGGYVSEDELRSAERQKELDEKKRRHELAVEQLRQRG